MIIGPASFNNVGWLDKLVLPKNDRHIIITVHYYQPMSFTHQGANWTPEYANFSGNTWGTPADYAALEKDFDGVQAWAKKNDRPILLGEFGAYDKGPLETRVKYTAALARAAEKGPGPTGSSTATSSCTTSTRTSGSSDPAGVDTRPLSVPDPSEAGAPS